MSHIIFLIFNRLKSEVREPSRWQRVLVAACFVVRIYELLAYIFCVNLSTQQAQIDGSRLRSVVEGAYIPQAHSRVYNCRQSCRRALASCSGSVYTQVPSWVRCGAVARSTPHTPSDLYRVWLCIVCPHSPWSHPLGLAAHRSWSHLCRNGAPFEGT